MKKILIMLTAVAVLFGACKDDKGIPTPQSPFIAKISPGTALENTVVTLSGKRFAKTAADNIVKFAGVRGEVLTASDTLLTVMVPAGGNTGTVTITVNNRTTNGPTFTYGQETNEIEYNYITSTYAGTGVAGDVYGPIAEAKFMLPNGVAYDATTGDLIVADRTAYSIKRITKDGEVIKIAGTGKSGTADGDFSVATFSNPYKSAVDKYGNIYVVDNGSHRVRKLDVSTGQVTTLAGSSSGFVDGIGSAARFNTLTGIAVDEDLNIYVADAANHAVRKITQAGVVTTLAGNGTAGIVDGVWPDVRMNRPTAVCIGKDGFLYAADRYGQRIRKIDLHTGKTVTIAGSGGSSSTTGGQVDGEALKARFNNPWGIEIDKDGTIYVSELGGTGSATHTIRMIKNGQVSTIGGDASFNAPGYVNGGSEVSRFYNPTDLAVDDAGNIFVGDMNNYVIRKITRVPKTN